MRQFRTKTEVFSLIKRSFEKNQRIPFLPQIILDVERALLKRDTGARELATIILDDPILTAKIIKLGNSLHYNSSNVKVKTVTQAIVVLGFEVVRSAVLNFSIIQLVRDLQGAKHFRACWKHSLATGILARAISGAAQSDMAEEAFVGGLLHDIGRLIISQIFTEHYDKVEDLCQRFDMTRLEAEREVFLCTHVDIGVFLAKEWSFPPGLTNVIEFHATDPFGQMFALNLPKTTQAVILAGELINTLDDPFAQNAATKLRRLKKRAQTILAVDPNQLDLFLDKLHSQVEQSAQVLDHIINDKTTPAQKTKTRGLHISPEKRIENLERRLDFVCAATEATYKHDSISQFFNDTARRFSRALTSNLFFILFYSHSSQSLKARLGYGPSASKIQPTLEVSIANTDHLLVDVFKYNKPIAITVDTIDKYSRLSEKSLFSTVLTTNISAAPIRLQDKVVGVLLVCREASVLNFDKDDMRLIMTYSQNITQVLRKGVL